MTKVYKVFLQLHLSTHRLVLNCTLAFYFHRDVTEKICTYHAFVSVPDGLEALRRYSSLPTLAEAGKNAQR